MAVGHKPTLLLDQIELMYAMTAKDVDPASPDGSESKWMSLPGPTGPVGPVGPIGPVGHPGPPGLPSYQVSPEEIALAKLQAIGNKFKVPAHPDLETQKQLLAEVFKAKSGISDQGKWSDVDMVELESVTQGNSRARQFESVNGTEAYLLAPKQYDAELVFETVQQVVGRIIDERSNADLRKVADIIAEALVEERKAWKQAHNAVTTDYCSFKLQTEQRSNSLAAQVAKLRSDMHDLTKQLVAAKAEVNRLEAENKKLIVKGTLNKSPRKLKVD